MSYEHWRHYARGWVFHFLNKTDLAYEAYTLAFRHNPQDVQSARHLAAIAAQRQDYSLAERWFLEVLRIAPEDAECHFNLGFVREQMKAPRLAIESFKTAVPRSSTTPGMAWGCSRRAARAHRAANARLPVCSR